MMNMVTLLRNSITETLFVIILAHRVCTYNNYSILYATDPGNLHPTYSRYSHWSRRSKNFATLSAKTAWRHHATVVCQSAYNTTYVTEQSCKDIYPIDAHCCYMDTAIKHSVPDRAKPSFVMFDIRALWRSALSERVARCQKLQMTGLTRSHTGCFIAVAIWQLGVKGLMPHDAGNSWRAQSSLSCSVSDDKLESFADVSSVVCPASTQSAKYWLFRAWYALMRSVCLNLSIVYDIHSISPTNVYTYSSRYHTGDWCK